MGESKMPPKTLAPGGRVDGLLESEIQVANATSMRVGLLINGFASSYYGLMVDGAVNHLKRCGVGTLVQGHSRSKDGELDAWMSLLDCDCDGLIAHVDSLTDEDLQRLMTMHDKVVLMNRPLDGFDGRCTWFDNERGGALAAEYLIAQGHQKFAMITGPERFFEVKARTAGFLSVLESAGFGLLPEHRLEGNFLEAGGAKAMQALMDSKKGFSAVFFHNDEMAIGALAACAEKGLRVPEDLSFIGFDDMPMSAMSNPALTTIRQPLHEIGEESARLMFNLLTAESEANETVSVNSRFDPVVVERDSVSRYGSKQSGQRLTPRESECLSWASQGKTAWEISVILAISQNTVTFHLVNAADKLNANNRTHAVAIAIRERVI